LTPASELIAYWKLDESEGTIAHDSVGANDANLLGDPVWQPLGGQIDGALEFDGVDDCVEAAFMIDPRELPFSVFAWVKGGGFRPGHPLRRAGRQLAHG